LVLFKRRPEDKHMNRRKLPIFVSCLFFSLNYDKINGILHMKMWQEPGSLLVFFAK
jgi:hypothetical protein